MKDRYYYQRENDRLDPNTDYEKIYQNIAFYDFPWDINQALNFALFRTYAAPSIGSLLYRTRELTHQAQKRYDDTVLILEAPVIHGLHSKDGLSAIRRMNQMHGMYDIPNEDLLYVLAAFVVVPVRWLDEYGWRKLSANEQLAFVNYYRELGRLMGIKGIPDTYAQFARLLDDYEAANFSFDAGSRKVADATMELLKTFHPPQAANLIDVGSRALMDPPLLEAFRFDEPGPLPRAIARTLLKARAKVVSFLPPKDKPVYVGEGPTIKSYPGGYRIEELGTFRHPAPGEGTGGGCPFPHAAMLGQQGHSEKTDGAQG